MHPHAEKAGRTRERKGGEIDMENVTRRTKLAVIRLIRVVSSLSMYANLRGFAGQGIAEGSLLCSSFYLNPRCLIESNSFIVSLLLFFSLSLPLPLSISLRYTQCVYTLIRDRKYREVISILNAELPSNPKSRAALSVFFSFSSSPYLVHSFSIFFINIVYFWIISSL